jgi:hypothetical protein
MAGVGGSRSIGGDAFFEMLYDAEGEFRVERAAQEQRVERRELGGKVAEFFALLYCDVVGEQRLYRTHFVPEDGHIAAGDLLRALRVSLLYGARGAPLGVLRFAGPPGGL